MKNQRGQMAIEMVLMIIVLVSFIFAVSRGLTESEYFAELVTTPWVATSGLIQNGVWGSPQNTMSKHPNHFERVSSVKADVAQKNGGP